jgi:hypothetical protein
LTVEVERRENARALGGRRRVLLQKLIRFEEGRRRLSFCCRFDDLTNRIAARHHAGREGEGWGKKRNSVGCSLM